MLDEMDENLEKTVKVERKYGKKYFLYYGFLDNIFRNLTHYGIMLYMLYQLVDGAAPLVFNPSDPNVYARYMNAMDTIKAVETEMAAKANAVKVEDDTVEARAAAGSEALRIMEETDLRIKKILNGIFGAGNDFNEILRGVNLMAVTSSGDRVINNVLNALSPIMEAGAKSCVETEIKEAKLNREQRRALGV